MAEPTDNATMNEDEKTVCECPEGRCDGSAVLLAIDPSAEDDSAMYFICEACAENCFPDGIRGTVV